MGRADERQERSRQEGKERPISDEAKIECLGASGLSLWTNDYNRPHEATTWSHRLWQQASQVPAVPSHVSLVS